MFKSKMNIIYFILTIFICILIFCFSSQNGSQSGDLSKMILKFLLDTFGFAMPAGLVSFLKVFIRKVAHFTIYLLLGFCIKGFLDNRPWYWSLIFCFLYACTDEFHQLFIDGRAGQFTDVCIDSAGAIFGILIQILVLRIMLQRRTNL